MAQLDFRQPEELAALRAQKEANHQTVHVGNTLRALTNGQIVIISALLSIVEELDAAKLPELKAQVADLYSLQAFPRE